MSLMDQVLSQKPIDEPFWVPSNSWLYSEELQGRPDLWHVTLIDWLVRWPDHVEMRRARKRKRYAVMPGDVYWERLLDGREGYDLGRSSNVVEEQRLSRSSNGWEEQHLSRSSNGREEHLSQSSNAEHVTSFNMVIAAAEAAKIRRHRKA